MLLSRNSFGADAVTLDVSATVSFPCISTVGDVTKFCVFFACQVPPVDTLGETNSWLVWADVTYPDSGFVLTGGTSAPINITA